jgi:predicted chitinase
MRLTRISLRRIAALLAAVIVAGCGLPSPPASPSASAAPISGFVVSRAQFEQAFPDRIPFYTYDGLVAELGSYPAFATTGDDATRRREVAAFLANVYHETNGLALVVEQNTAAYGNYCDASAPFGCPAGRAAYFGRGPVQLSWNYNYRAAGDVLGLDLLADPALVQRDPAVAWKTALWFWNTQAAEAADTSHDAMVGRRGFGETIRAFNGLLECDGGNPAQVQSRVNAYLRITALLGVTPGQDLSC